MVDGLALGVGQHHAVIGMPHAVVQLPDFFAGNAHEQVCALAALPEQWFAEDARPLQGTGVQVMLLHGASPRIENQRRHRSLGQAIGVANHTTDAVDVFSGVRGEHKASGSRSLLLCPLLSAHASGRTSAG